MIMTKAITAGLTILLLGIGTLIRPANTFAQIPVFNVDFQAEDLTTGSGWQNPITVNAGDKLRFKAVITNTGDITALEVTVRMPLFTSDAPIQYTSVHILANNATIPDAPLTININNGSMSLAYVPGSSNLNQNGSTRSITPDTATDNITTEQIAVGSIAPGSGNAVTLQYDANPVTVGTTPTVTPAPTGTTTAVASTTPKTGVGDSLWVTTGGWLGLGIIGFVMRKWALGLLA
jgi:hypothetical protein